MQKIVPFLWYDGQAEEAMNHYLSIFKNSKAGTVSRMGPDGPVFSATFTLEGQEFYALNGGPKYKFTPAVSLFVNCDGQAEVDELYTRLSAGGSEDACGWIRDKFGLSWQIIPTRMGQLMGDKNPAKAQAVMQAMLTMKKIDLAALEEAYARG
ncbi:MAG: VOC family protein [Gemmatimonadota bacterium]